MEALLGLDADGSAAIYEKPDSFDSFIIHSEAEEEEGEELLLLLLLLE